MFVDSVNERVVIIAPRHLYPLGPRVREHATMAKVYVQPYPAHLKDRPSAVRVPRRSRGSFDDRALTPTRMGPPTMRRNAGYDGGGRAPPKESRGPSSDHLRASARKKLRKVRTMIVASQAFSDGGKRRRERRESDPNNLTAAPRIDEDAELAVVDAAQHKLHAHRGPAVSRGVFVSAGLSRALFGNSAPDDIRKHTIVTQHLVLGCREDAMDLKTMKAIGVTHILNTCKQLPNYHPEHFVYHKIPLMDAPDAPIGICCDVAASFLQRVERVGGRALVHCIAGSSRSVTLLIMHLIISHRVPLHVAFHHINKLRPQANPNQGFKLELAMLELKVLGGSSVATNDAGPQWNFYAWNMRKGTLPQIPERHGKKRPGEGSSACVLQ